MFDTAHLIHSLHTHWQAQPTFPPLQAVYLFGSRAAGTAHAQSDVDVALLCGGKVDALALWQMAQTMELHLHSPLDLVDLRHASTVLQYQVITQGKQLWCEPQHRLAVGLFENFVLSEYTELNLARAGLLHDIAQRGRVYAEQ